MKRVVLLILIIIGLSCAVSFPALCQEPGIAGTWTIPIKFQGKTVALYVRFDIDGRYWQWSPQGSAQGTYVTYGNELKMTINDGQVFNSHFYLASPNILVLQGRDGEFQYARVADAAIQPPENSDIGQNQVAQDNQQDIDLYGEKTGTGSSVAPQETPYEQGCKFFEQGDLDQALAAFNQAIAQDSDNAQALYKRGLIYKKLNQAEKSWDDLEKAYQLDPGNKDCYKAMMEVGWAAASEGLDKGWEMAKELQKKREKERLSKQLPYRLAGSAISILILSGFWFFFFRKRKSSGTPRTGSSKFFRVLGLIFGIALTLFVLVFVSGTIGPYFSSRF
jgi:hypothetical protein